MNVGLSTRQAAPSRSCVTEDMKGHDRDGRNERRGRTGDAEKSEPFILKATKSSAPNVHSQAPRN
jgi:hypothetical protein